MAKEQISIRFTPCTIDILREIVRHGLIDYGKDEDGSMRGFLESLIWEFIYNDLSRLCVPGQVVRASMPFVKLCRTWLDYRKASRGEAGYKLYRRPKTDKKFPNLIVAIKSPDVE